MTSWGWELHPGASGGSTDPDRGPYLTGAYHPTAGEFLGANRNSLAQDRMPAQAPPVYGPGVLSSDKSHDPSLDGHAHSAVARHPDGQFAQNTAATSSHSLSANVEHLIAWGYQETDPKGPAQDHLLNPSGPSGSESTATLASTREQRVRGVLQDGSLLVKDASRLEKLLDGPFTNAMMLGGALGATVLYSMA